MMQGIGTLVKYGPAQPEAATKMTTLVKISERAAANAGLKLAQPGLFTLTDVGVAPGVMRGRPMPTHDGEPLVITALVFIPDEHGLMGPGELGYAVVPARLMRDEDAWRQAMEVAKADILAWKAMEAGR